MPFRREKGENSELFYKLHFTLPIKKADYRADALQMSSLTSAYTVKTST